MPAHAFHGSPRDHDTSGRGGMEADREGRDLLRSWHPAVGMSANVERIFNSLEDAARHEQPAVPGHKIPGEARHIRPLSSHGREAAAGGLGRTAGTFHSSIGVEARDFFWRPA